MNAYFAGGCFWCITPFFKLYGADRVVCGYSGGLEENPSYQDVKSQKTGHRETIMIEYSPNVISYHELLEIFLANVDPFDGGGQFIDRGHSYTLAVYYTSEEERLIAEEGIRKLQEERGKKAEIAVEPFRSFYPAEEEHQDYYLKNPEAFEKEMAESGRTRKNQSYAEKNHQLFLRQKALLDQFLSTGAISQKQHDKSLRDLIEKMGESG